MSPLRSTVPLTARVPVKRQGEFKAPALRARFEDQIERRLRGSAEAREAASATSRSLASPA